MRLANFKVIRILFLSGSNNFVIIGSISIHNHPWTNWETQSWAYIPLYKRVIEPTTFCSEASALTVRPQAP